MAAAAADQTTQKEFVMGLANDVELVEQPGDHVGDGGTCNSDDIHQGEHGGGGALDDVPPA